MTPTDHALEARIQVTAWLITKTHSTERRRELFDELRNLIGQRSPQAIRELEKTKGLR